MASSPSQLIDQATRHAVHLERLKTGEYRKIRSLLTEMVDNVSADLGKSNITEWRRSKLEKQLSEYKKALRQGTSKSKLMSSINRSVLDLASYESSFEVKSLARVSNFNFTIPSENQIISAVRSNPLQVSGANGGKLLEAVFDNFADDAIDGILQSIRLGYAQGDTTSQIIRRLKDQVELKLQHHLRGLVRTSLAHAAQQAREITWQANRDIVKGVRWVSTLDSKTSDICQSLDGRFFALDDGPRPPAHYNCRSTTVAALDDRFSVLDRGATRFARDPQTGRPVKGGAPAKQTYYGWLKTQPADVQDDIIGPTRGKLLRDGGLSAQRFAELQLGKTFEPLTLVEMRRLEPLAFARAGL